MATGRSGVGWNKCRQIDRGKEEETENTGDGRGNIAGVKNENPERRANR
jgi:hypothetical protein